MIWHRLCLARTCGGDMAASAARIRAGCNQSYEIGDWSRRIVITLA